MLNKNNIAFSLAINYYICYIIVMAIVYQHRRLDTNEIFYIGIGTRKDRYKSKLSRSDFWNYTVNKYGFIPEIIFNDIDIKEAKHIEKYLISYYGRKDLGLGNLVNLTDGAEGTYNHSIETRIKMGAANVGKTPWNKGMPMSEESKLKCSKANLGKVSPRKGVKLSKETKDKLSKAKIGNTNAKGKVRTKEMNKQNSLTKTKYIYFMFKDGILIKEFKSMTNAVEYSKSNRSCITRASKGERKSAGGYTWKRELK